MMQVAGAGTKDLATFKVETFNLCCCIQEIRSGSTIPTTTPLGKTAAGKVTGRARVAHGVMARHGLGRRQDIEWSG